jgi:hypothetical protein
VIRHPQMPPPASSAFQRSVSRRSHRGTANAPRSHLVKPCLIGSLLMVHVQVA